MSITGMSDEEFIKLRARNHALSEIIYVTRVGEVEGIRFDLRHPDIDPKDWEMEHLGITDRLEPRRRRGIPFIWFPWFEQLDLEKLKREVAAEAHAEKDRAPIIPREAHGNVSDAEYEKIVKRLKKTQSKFSVTECMRREMKDRTPEAVVAAGDLIGVRKILSYVSDDVFRPDSERGIKFVFVRITRKNGDMISLDRPIVMHSATRLSRRGGRHPVYAVMERVKRHFRIDDLSSETAIETLGNFRKKGSNYAALYYASFLSLYYLPKFEKNDAWQTIGALDHACLLGYTWAQAEHDLHMRPYAEVGRKNIARARAAGGKSGQSRRREAEETWEPHALALAKKARAVDPTVSREKLAGIIQDGWRLAIRAPAHSTLTGLVARSERQGKLAIKMRRNL